MRHFIILFFLFVFQFNAYSQRHMFGKTGTMATSNMRVDTIIHVTSKRERRIYLFKIEAGYNDSLNLRKYLPGKYFAADSNSYFILANLTGKSLTIGCLNNQLLTEENCEFENRIYKPIDILVYPKCTTSYPTKNIMLKPFDVLIFRNWNSPSGKIDGITRKTYIRLKTSTGVIRSPLYSKSIKQTDFFLSTELKADYDYQYRQILFKE